MIMFYLQIATAIISILLGITQVARESQPLLNRNIYQNKATQIASMQISWQFRGQDEIWRYYSDPTGRYWARVNAQGICEYSENPRLQIATNAVGIQK